MKGRPITVGEFEQMLEATAEVVGPNAAVSWRFALKILWTSAFRIGDLMSFSWDDTRQIPSYLGKPSPDNRHSVSSEEREGPGDSHVAGACRRTGTCP